MELNLAMLNGIVDDLSPQERDLLRAYRQGKHDAGLGYFFPPKRENNKEYAAYLTGWEVEACDAFHS